MVAPEPMSPDTLNAWRIHCTNLVLLRLATQRNDVVACGTIEGVKATRAKAVEDIRAIYQPDWQPDLESLPKVTYEIVDGHLREKLKSA